MLPTPKNVDGTIASSIVLIVSAVDSLGGISNNTISIEVQSLKQKIDMGVNFEGLAKRINAALSFPKPYDQSVLPSMFIASNELTDLYND
jgi:hypothetical protein